MAVQRNGVTPRIDDARKTIQFLVGSAWISFVYIPARDPKRPFVESGRGWSDGRRGPLPTVQRRFRNQLVRQARAIARDHQW